MEQGPEKKEENRSMGEQETLEFVRRKIGLKQLEVKEWELGDSILYVLTEEAKGHHAYKSKNKIPSFAVLYGIEKITYAPRSKNGLSIPYYFMENPKGGKVMYFAIDSKTMETAYLYTSDREKRGINAYQAREDTIFTIDDSIKLPKEK